MVSVSSILAALAFMATSVSAADDMGPAAFMWPPDRSWSAAADNTAPCGTVAAVGNRTEFPIHPESNSDFTTLIDAKAFRELDPGHTCVNVANAPSSINSGANATLQIMYIADFDTPDNQTFYACADITYVELTDFDTAIPCFNATQPEDSDSDSDSDSGSDHSDSDSDENDAEPSSSPKSDGESKSGLSGGAIAGIVVGSVAGVGLIALAVLLMYRRKQQRLRTVRQQQSSRGVDWEGQPGKDSVSNSSVRMQNLSTS